MDDLTGKQLGTYQIVEELGRGGMAVVYRAYQPSLNRYVAIKVLPPQLSFDDGFVQRFRREAQAAARLRHPNIVVVHDVAQHEGIHYIVMEYLAGRTLKQVIEQDGPLPLSQATRIVEQVASALDYAHLQGFVHRDVKPSNIFVDQSHHVTLTDFGIAKAASESEPLTRTGLIMGTPEYMAPEQAEGSSVDHRTDLYALGIVLYHMLVGRLPFQGTTPHATLHAVIYEPPPPLRRIDPSISPAIEAVALRAIAKQPSQRFQRGADLVAALRTAMAGGPERVVAPPPPAGVRPPPPARPPQRRSPTLWVMAGLVAVLLILLGALVLLILGGDKRQARTLTPTTQVAALGTATPTVGEGTATPGAGDETPPPAETATIAPATDKPGPTDTSAPSTDTPEPPTDTPQPPTATPTSTPTPTFTSTPSPTPSPPPCAFPAQGLFAGLWQTYRYQLGCPLYQDPKLIQDAEQAFENGHMFWRQDNDHAYAVFEKGQLSGTYEAFVGIWSSGDPEYPCPASPPPGRVQPKRGFGAAWCTLGGASGAIGWGLGEEAGFGPGYGDPLVQDFERGFIFRDSDGKTKGMAYVFFRDNKKFVRKPY
jgi:predicted Ser/Thr protein kinase